MKRFATAGLALIVLLGCDDVAESLKRVVGAPTALAAERPWRFESAPAIDTLPTRTRRIWSGPQVDVTGSPFSDGRRWAHTDWDTGDISIYDLETGEERHLTDNAVPYEPGWGMFARISPDERWVAYTWLLNEPRVNQLRIVDVEGSRERVLSSDFWIEARDWSPDGRSILALRQLEDGICQITLVSVEDGSTVVLKTLDWRFPTRMVFSPDGRYVLYDFPQEDEDVEERDVYVLAVDGSSETTLVRHPANDVVLGWAPDGQHVLFASDRTGAPSAWLLPVQDGRSAGDPVLVKPDFWGAGGIGFTPDGSFFYGVETSSVEIYVATLDPEGGRIVGSPARATPRSMGERTWPSWSPDGRHMAYLQANLVGQATLAIRSLESREVRSIRLPLEIMSPRNQRWLPDGRTLLIKATDDKARNALFRVDVQRGTTEAVFRKPVDTGIAYFDLTPDGRSVLYVSLQETDQGRVSTILLRDLASGEEREIYRHPRPDSQKRFRGLAVSPEGDRLAFHDGDFLSVMVLPTEAGETREVQRIIATRGRGLFTVWTSDGRWLLFVRDKSIWRVAATGGEPQDLGIRMDGIRHLRLSPDGRRLAFTAGDQSTEVWVMDHFLPTEEERDTPR